MTRAESKAFDRLALEQFHVPGIVLMENAARGAAELALKMLADKPSERVLIACGPGNNGGDGFAIARHLHLAGVAVRVLPMAKEWKADADVNWSFETASNLLPAYRQKGPDYPSAQLMSVRTPQPSAPQP